MGFNKRKMKAQHAIHCRPPQHYEEQGIKFLLAKELRRNRKASGGVFNLLGELLGEGNIDVQRILRSCWRAAWSEL